MGMLAVSGLARKRFDYLVAIHLRHHDIQQNQVRVFCFRLFKTLKATIGGYDLIALFLEHQTNQFQGINIIVNNENLLGHNLIPPRTL